MSQNGTRRFPLNSAVASFYLLEELIGRLCVDPQIEVLERKSRLVNDATALQGFIIEHTAAAMFDYIVLACFGEARHAEKRGGAFIQELVGMGASGRDLVYKCAVEYEPFAALGVLERLFRDFDWAIDFGGRKWAKIAKVGSAYKTMPKKIWLDSAVWLMHNGGLAYSKPIIFLPSGLRHYTDILNNKQKGSLLGISYFWDGSLQLPRSVWGVLERDAETRALLLEGQQTSLAQEAPRVPLADDDIAYSPIRWGAATLTLYEKKQVGEREKIRDGKKEAPSKTKRVAGFREYTYETRCERYRV